MCVANRLGREAREDSQVRDKGCDAAWRSGLRNGKHHGGDQHNSIDRSQLKEIKKAEQASIQ